MFVLLLPAVQCFCLTNGINTCTTQLYVIVVKWRLDSANVKVKLVVT